MPFGRVRGRWTALEVTADGGFVYAAEDPVPVWGRLAAGGRATLPAVSHQHARLAHPRMGRNHGSAAQRPPPVLAIGVNHFDDASFESLHFAVADAAGVVAAANQREGAFPQVHALEVSDGTGGASGKRVTEALKFLEGAGPGDTVVLFLASHGISDSQGNYYFVPHRCEKRRRRAGSGRRELGRFSDPMVDVLRCAAHSPGRRIVIVDTC
jgi:hypothetical protein